MEHASGKVTKELVKPCTVSLEKMQGQGKKKVGEYSPQP